MDAEGDKGQKKQNIVWGPDAPERPPAPAAAAQPPARRQDALAPDGQLVEAGYGHGV